MSDTSQGTRDGFQLRRFRLRMQPVFIFRGNRGDGNVEQLSQLFTDYEIVPGPSAGEQRTQRFGIGFLDGN